jgi:hypothetical protein
MRNCPKVNLSGFQTPLENQTPNRMVLYFGYSDVYCIRILIFTWLVNGNSTKLEFIQPFFDTQFWLVIEDEVVHIVLIGGHTHDVIGLLFNAVAFRPRYCFKNSSATTMYVLVRYIFTERPVLA